MSRIFLALTVSVLTMGTAAQAGIITNDFTSGEMPPSWTGLPAPTFVNGVGLSGSTFYALGVTFTFSDTSGQVYGAPVNAGEIVNGLQGPGDTTITLAFDHPSTFLSFDMDFGVGVTPTGSVVLDGGNPVSFATADLGTGIAAGTFSSGTVLPFTTATISFDGGPVMYGLGNLTYDPPDPPGVPEPASITLLGLAMLAVGAVARVRRASSGNCGREGKRVHL